jgi:hypothetical protein
MCIKNGVNDFCQTPPLNFGSPPTPTPTPPLKVDPRPCMFTVSNHSTVYCCEPSPLPTIYIGMVVPLLWDLFSHWNSLVTFDTISMRHHVKTLRIISSSQHTKRS